MNIRLTWNAGPNLQRLPFFLRPIGILARNLQMIFKALMKKPLYSQPEVLKQLKLGVQYIYEADVQGDVAEFGTAWGTTAQTIAQGIAAIAKHYNEPQRTLYLFDSFEGLPKSTTDIDKQSPHVQAGIWEEGRCQGLYANELRKKCEKILPANNVRIYEGWFNETLTTLPAGTKFAFVHVDSDLYQSAKDVLDFCFSEKILGEGAVVFFDDWNCNRARRDMGERRAWEESVKKYSVDFSDCGEYGSAGWKFIVHGYQK